MSVDEGPRVRYRAVSDSAQREQTRRVVFGVITAITVSAALELPRFFFPALNEPTPAALVYELVFTAVWNLSLALIPITVAIAVIRQRLFDIDILIRRSLVYVLLTAILAGVLAVITSGAQKQFLAFTGEQSAWVPLLATLVVVAAFDPVKKALQDAVDRRFKAPGDAASRLAPFRNAIETRISAVDTRALLI